MDSVSIHMPDLKALQLTVFNYKPVPREVGPFFAQFLPRTVLILRQKILASFAKCIPRFTGLQYLLFSTTCGLLRCTTTAIFVGAKTGAGVGGFLSGIASCRLGDFPAIGLRFRLTSIDLISSDERAWEKHNDAWKEVPHKDFAVLAGVFYFWI
jgi:hypothetical protein